MNIILLAEGYLECPLCKQQLLKRNELEATLDNLSMEECKKLNERMKNYKGLYFTYVGLSGLDKNYNVVPSPYTAEAEKIKNINNFK
jgi:hypothetical protein